MTKASKARHLAQLEKELAYLDLLMDLNSENETAVKSFQEQYKKLTITLAEIRDCPTTD
jgi:hypothetical protein